MKPKDKLAEIERLCMFFMGDRQELETEILKIIRQK